VILAHFTSGDVPSMGLVFGVAFLFLGFRRRMRGQEANRQLALGAACLAVGLIAGFR
jgi:hypothetical protein